MSEIPAPPEVIDEAAKADAPETPKPETGKNYDIEKMFDDFRKSPEYQAGFDKRSHPLRRRMVSNFTEEEKEELLKAGYEGYNTNVAGAPFDFESIPHEEYKEAFMNYVTRFHDETGLWPLYFSPDLQSEAVTAAYEDYKERALIVKAHVEHGTDFRQQGDIDGDRSKAHDRLANLLLQESRVNTLLDGKLVARMWLVADRIDSPYAIVSMDKARQLRGFEQLKNIETKGSLET